MSIVSKKDIYGKGALIISSILLIQVIYSSFFKGGDVSKIGVVEMDKLVYEFKGMKEATEDYTVKMNKWSSEHDSLENQLKNYLKDIRMDSLNGDDKKLKLDQQKFLILRKAYMEFDESIKEKSQKQDQEMTIGVINQLKSYMKEYAEDNDYDLILTNTQMQSIGYVRSVHEVTPDMIEYANSKFDGKN